MIEEKTADKTSVAFKKLQRAFVKALGVPADADFDSLEYSKHKSWDSVAHMVLVSELELAFGIMLENKDIIGMSSFSVAIEILQKHDVRFDA